MKATTAVAVTVSFLLPAALTAGDWSQPITGTEAVGSTTPATSGWHIGFDELQFAPSVDDQGAPVGSVRYQHQFGSDFDSLPGEVESHDASLVVPLPPLSNGNLRILSMLSYRATWFDTDGPAPSPSLIPEDTLHAVRLPVVALVDLSDKWIAGGMVMPGYSGDGSDFGDGFSISAAVGAGYNYSQALKIFGGVFYSNGFDDDILVPGVGFLYRPNPQWSAFLLPPFGGINYRHGDDWVIGLTGRWESTTWNVESDALGPDRDVKVSGLRVGLKVERRLSERFWAFVEGGMFFARELEVETLSSASLVEDDIDSGGYIQAGLNLRY